MGRPRKITDDQLLSACVRVIGAHGPGFTLAQVAAEAEVAVGTVSNRFGSKQALLTTLMRAGTEDLEHRMLAAAGAEHDPVDAVRAAVLGTLGTPAEPAEAVHHLAQLGVDLANAELRAGVAAHRELIRTVLARLLADADLPKAPPPREAAGVLAALAHGIELDWALEALRAPEARGELSDQVRVGVDVVLTAWQAGHDRKGTTE